MGQGHFTSGGREALPSSRGHPVQAGRLRRERPNAGQPQALRYPVSGDWESRSADPAQGAAELDRWYANRIIFSDPEYGHQDDYADAVSSGLQPLDTTEFNGLIIAVGAMLASHRAHLTAHPGQADAAAETTAEFETAYAARSSSTNG